MTQEQKEQGPIIDALIAAAVGALIKEIPQLTEKAIHAIFHKHKEDIIKAAIPVTVDALAPCPPGFIRDPRTGECVTDPGKKL